MLPIPGLWICFYTGVAVLSLATPVFGQFAYVANQFSNDVSGYTINATTGTLTPIPGSPFAAGVFPVSVAVDPTGKFSYVANQFSNDVSGYTINAATGTLTPIPGSPFAAVAAPLSVVVDPTGRFAYVANANSANISGYTNQRHHRRADAHLRIALCRWSSSVLRSGGSHG